MRKALEKARIIKKFSVEEIAEMVKVSPSTWYKWEAGTRDPSLKNAQKIVDLLGETVEELFFTNKLDEMSNLYFSQKRISKGGDNLFSTNQSCQKKKVTIRSPSSYK
ncbi:helix-turn-helix transcriptional regulator [Pelosinus baikalensis]|uniref:Helix-turn-helix domain-containing protein n=1 Tax=Pelosinus baikalensis TaxID=2892015 RepID=A0ABS8HXP5_9FIRM|nr:helix-turn-helix transcriptional regulator [Pelosinus baikalensis]MCC5467366.1 helix-turn-helix domain-containing protein [Pelosinus baikalensis]